MTRLIFAAVLAAAWATSVAPGAAQQRLRLNVQEVIGPAVLERDGYGCFDPLAALRFDADITAGGVSDTTQEAFAVGSCVALPKNISLTGATRILLEGQAFVRGDIADTGITAYLPYWSTALTGVDDGYDPARVELASPVDQTAVALQERVSAFQQCADDGEALEKRIVAYNERAIAADPKKDPTGSRLVRGSNSSPVFQMILPDERYRDLFEEARILQADIDAFWARCGEYQSAITLDKDYLAFLEAAI